MASPAIVNTEVWLKGMFLRRVLGIVMRARISGVGVIIKQLLGMSVTAAAITIDAIVIMIRPLVMGGAITVVAKTIVGVATEIRMRPFS